ncbi:effector-associated domain 2-containing protein [Amycolatopsis plumensis]|uniref:VMAP-C domain-containing protein n=1 Tax=Amycolatopsis plumensis TaxID=236508 RepID=UPI003621AF53
MDRQVSTGLSLPGLAIEARKALVDVLVEAGFDDRSARSLMVSELRIALRRPFTVPDQLTPRDQLIEIVGVCSRLEEGMGALASVLELMRPGSPECVKVRQLVASLPARDLFPEAQQDELKAWLDGLVPERLPVLVSRAARHAAQTPPRFDEAWAAFSYLADLNSPPGELPPALVFVELLAAACEEPRRAWLREWSSGQARRFRLEQALRELRSDAEGAEPGRDKLHLMIVIQPDAIDLDRFQVCSWRQDEPDEWPPARGETASVSAAELEEHVDGIVAEAEEIWSGRMADVVLEFVLPRSLVNIPVHSWSAELRSGDPQPLSLSYPIVIRSFERMAYPRWHRRWRLRWRKLVSEAALEHVYFCRERDTEERFRLDAILGDQRWVMMVLTESPPRRPVPGQDQLLAALRAGLPALVWHPTATPDVLRQVVSWLVENQGLGELPARTQRSRQAVFQNRQVPFDLDVFRDLVVLWDDPSRLVFLGGTASHLAQGGSADDRDEAS